MLVNSSLSGFFPSSKGLGQRDPLSSYLFVWQWRHYYYLLEKAREIGFLLGFRVRGRRVRGWRCFLFCLLMTPEIQMLYLSWLLMWFETLSSLKINLEKVN